MAALTGPAKPLLSLNPQEDTKFKKEVVQVRRHASKQQEKQKLTPGVIYVGHLPPSLYETQIRAYFPSLALLQDSDCPGVPRQEIAKAMVLWSLNLKMLPK